MLYHSIAAHSFVLPWAQNIVRLRTPGAHITTAVSCQQEDVEGGSNVLWNHCFLMPKAMASMSMTQKALRDRPTRKRTDDAIRAVFRPKLHSRGPGFAGPSDFELCSSPAEGGCVWAALFSAVPPTGLVWSQDKKSC
jgi:hypothetical protein